MARDQRLDASHGGETMESTVTERLSFIVKRPLWYRGQHFHASALVRADNRMCCVGFLGLACGLSARSMLNIPTAHRVESPTEQAKWPAAFQQSEAPVYGLTSVAEIYQVNDSPRLSEEEREAKLTTLFDKLNITITFED